MGATDHDGFAVPRTAGDSPDRRVQKTHALLHRALGQLIREKDYDQITVGDIFERADVGRSTFYTHFRDKDELLVSAMHDVLQAAQVTGQSPSLPPDERIVAFSLPLLELHRWIDKRPPSSPAAADEAFRALVQPALAGSGQPVRP